MLSNTNIIGLKLYLPKLFIILTLLNIHWDAHADNRVLARRLSARLAGVPFPIDSEKFLQMVRYLDNGDRDSAAQVATRDPGFLTNTVKQTLTPLFNVEGNPVEPVVDSQRFTNDALLLAMGLVAHGNSPNDPSYDRFHALLTADYGYNFVANPDSSDPNVNLTKDNLVKDPTAFNAFDPEDRAGILSTKKWAKEFYSAGTNRRAVKGLIERMLCLSLDQVRTREVPDPWVGRDVDRSPGGDTTVYSNTCKTCHATFLDPLRGAFGYFVDFRQGNTMYDRNVFATQANRDRSKYSTNRQTFSAGFETTDRSWRNLMLTPQHMAKIGWSPDGPMEGVGAKSLGMMFAKSSQFNRCMVQNVFQFVCARPPVPADQSTIDALAAQFKITGNLQTVFEKAAVLEQCLGKE